MPHRIRPALLILLLWLGGCATTPPTAPPPTDPRATAAARRMAQGDYAAAARAYQELAARSQGPPRARYRVLAADALLQADQPDPARAQIQGLDPSALPAEVAHRLRLVQAALALRDGDAQGALTLSEGLAPVADPTLRRRALALQAAAWQKLGRPLQRARTLMHLDPLLEDPARRLELEQEILDTLVNAPSEALAALPQRDDPLIRGWLELADLARGFSGDPTEVAGPLAQWRALYPAHPALPELLPGYLESHRRARLPAHPRHIAVLLPARGRYAPAARAIRDGFLAAWYADPDEQRPELSFHDSGRPDQIWPLLNQVAESGADLVVGPLAKAAVRQLVRAGPLPLPVLALNAVDADTPPPERLFQYSLSPADEARQAAVWLAAHRHALPGVLVPDGTRGARLLRAFSEQWTALGGEPPRSRTYHRPENDYATAVAELLDIPRQKKEHEQAEEEAGEKLPFEPELPVDSVVILGNQTDLRQLRPLVRFYYGIHLPVLTLSHAWNGRLDREALFDLKGVQLPDIPWLVTPASPEDPLSPQAMTQDFPRAMKHYPRLLAMGMDAYRLATELARIAGSPDTPLPGRTGELSLDPLRHFHRRLVWIELNQPPRLLGLTPQPDEVPPVQIPPPRETTDASAAR